jgi:hypothetical protein
MLRATVRLRVAPGALGHLPRYVDQAAGREAVAAAGPPDAEGWRVVDLLVESPEVAAHQLLPLAGGGEALDPPALRSARAAAGRAMAALND